MYTGFPESISSPAYPILHILSCISSSLALPIILSCYAYPLLYLKLYTYSCACCAYSLLSLGLRRMQRFYRKNPFAIRRGCAREDLQGPHSLAHDLILSIAHISIPEASSITFNKLRGQTLTCARTNSLTCAHTHLRTLHATHLCTRNAHCLGSHTRANLSVRGFGFGSGGPLWGHTRMTRSPCFSGTLAMLSGRKKRFLHFSTAVLATGFVPRRLQLPLLLLSQQGLLCGVGCPFQKSCSRNGPSWAGSALRLTPSKSQVRGGQDRRILLTVLGSCREDRCNLLKWHHKGQTWRSQRRSPF